MYSTGGGDKGWKKTILICVAVVLISTLPIYALDSYNTTYNQTVNSVEHQSHNDNGQLSAIKNGISGKYKDVQDLRLKILQILEEIRLLRQGNETSSLFRYELEEEYAELQSKMRSII
ncbi:hypothetical protein, partial [Methanobacterium sp.]